MNEKGLKKLKVSVFLLILMVFLLFPTHMFYLVLNPFLRFFYTFLQFPPRKYSLENATVKVEIMDDGRIRVREVIGFVLNGMFSEVYVWHPFRSTEQGDPSLPLAKIRLHKCSYGVPKTRKGYNKLEFSCNFPRKVYDNKKVRMEIEYDVIKGLKIYTDVAELHQKLWGEEWEVWLPKLSVSVKLPEDSKILKYYFHPAKVENVRITKSMMEFEAREIPPNCFFETRILLTPKDSFLENSVYMGGKIMEKVKSIEGSYFLRMNVKKFSFFIALLLTISSFFILSGIYYLYGKEEKIPSRIFEREPPYPVKPYVVDLIVNKDVIDVSYDGFLATFLDLIRVGAFSIKLKSSSKGNEKEYFIKGNYSLAEAERILTKPEFIVYSTFYLSHKYWMNLEMIRDSLKFKDLYGILQRFKEKVTEECEEMLKKYFMSKGSKYAQRVGNWTFLLGMPLFLFSSEWVLTAPSILYPLFPFIPFIVITPILLPIILFLLPSKIFGKFTREGIIFYKRWKAFERFLTNVSLIKKYPPASLIIWNEYLVYATALGVAKKTTRILKRTIPQEKIEKDVIFSFYLYSPSYFPSLPSTTYAGVGGFSGGMGGIGGGFGGGGGGAR